MVSRRGEKFSVGFDVSSYAKIAQVNILGIGIDTLDMHSTAIAIKSALINHYKGYICLCGVHGVMQAQNEPELRSALANSLLVAPDGTPTVWVGHLQGFKNMKRVFGPDLMIEIMSKPEFIGITHFLCGGDYGVAEELKSKLIARIPQLRIVGTYTPPFRAMNKEEEAELENIIEFCRPDIMWIGLSTPKQELFMARHLSRLDTTLMIGVGAAFLFHTGKIRDSSAWVKLAGLQWLHRLIQEPERLWRRYLFANPMFLIKIVVQLLGLRRYQLSPSRRPDRQSISCD